MRDDAGRKSETLFLRGSIHRSQQATACESAFPCIRVDNDLPHSRQIDHHPVITCAEPGEAVSPTADGWVDSGGRSRTNRSLHVSNVSAAGNQARAARHHAVPNGSRRFVPRIIRAQQVAAELLPQDAVNLVGSFLHEFCA
jgi:hypothetical protein